LFSTGVDLLLSYLLIIKLISLFQSDEKKKSLADKMRERDKLVDVQIEK
jgi:hypothetical protein